MIQGPERVPFLVHSLFYKGVKMPKPDLPPEEAKLENEMIEIMKNGLHEWRADLDFPESYSDMQACVRGLLKEFEIKKR